MTSHRRMLGPLVLAALMQAIMIPPLLGEGLPSLEKGVFHSATIAYYLETVLVSAKRFWWTSRWCAGFQDLLRFYPPLGLFILEALLRAVGIFWSIGLAMAIALMVLTLGIMVFAESMVGYKLPIFTSVIAALSILSLEAWVSTISIYWEYTRLLGDGFGFLSLGLLYRSIQEGSAEKGVIAGIAGGLAVLSSLLTFTWLAIAVPVLILGTILEAYKKSSIPYAESYPLRISWYFILAFITISGWWLVPAFIPWGISHYLRVHAGFFSNIRILAYSLAINPPIRAPAIQLPLFTASLGSLALLWRRRIRIPVYLAASIFMLVMFAGQGSRLIPVLGIVLVIGIIQACFIRENTAARMCRVALLLLLLAYAAYYYPGYVNRLKTDWSFMASDEYKVSKWLEIHAAENVRIYAMYGENLHGNQWLNVFSPKTSQVLSGFMEGCMNPKVFLLDHYIKNTLDASSTKRMIEELGIRYLVVDKAWYNGRKPNVVEILKAQGYLSPVSPLDKNLRYSVLFEVNKESRIPRNTEIRVEYLTPARMLGIATSVSALLILTRGKHGDMEEAGV